MQNGFKNIIRKIAAISAGALMTGATMFGAVAAASLSDYPAPFITGGKWVGLIVVGSGAAAADIIGATDIAATLAQSATTAAGSASSTVTGGKAYDIPLGTTMYAKFGSALTATDLTGFQDTSITIDRSTGSTSYNIKDELDLGASYPKVTTGLIEASTSKEWGKDIWVTMSGSGQLTYYYKFKTNLASGDYITNSNGTSGYPTTINFLGKNLKITGATDTTLTADVGEERFMNVDDSVVINGKTVKLLNVGSATTNPPVIVDVGGVQQTITGTQLVNGLRIKVSSAFYSDTRAERSATLIIGTDASKTFNNGDPYIDEDKNDPNWTWYLSLSSATPTIAIKQAKSYVTPAGTNKPFKIGDVLSSPNGYFKMTIGDPTTTSYKDYTFNFIATGVDLYTYANTAAGTNIAGLEITTSGGGKNGFKVWDGAAASKYTDKLFVYTGGASANVQYLNVSWANADQGNHYQPTNTSMLQAPAVPTGLQTQIATIVTPDTTAGLPLMASLNNATGVVQIWVDGLQNIYMNSTTASRIITRLGAVVGTAAAVDVMIDAVEAGTMDADGRTQDGIIVNSIKSNADADMVKLSIPSKVGTDFAVKATIAGTGTTVTTAKGGTVIISSVSGVPVAKLDTEVTDKTAYNMILVGGPAVNILTKELMPTPTIVSGEATLKLVENAFSGTKVALLVVGYDAADTRTAATVLKDYTSYSTKLTGKEVIVKSAGGVISVSAPAVAATA